MKGRHDCTHYQSLTQSFHFLKGFLLLVLGVKGEIKPSEWFQYFKIRKYTMFAKFKILNSDMLKYFPASVMAQTFLLFPLISTLLAIFFNRFSL